MVKIIKKHPENFMKMGEINVNVVAVKFDIPTSTSYRLLKMLKKQMNL
jgi:hypothetical protein